MSLALDPSFSHAPGTDLLGKLSRAVGAALALGITAVHVVDQGGLIGDKGPRYVGVGYWLLELAGIAFAVLLEAALILLAAAMLARRAQVGASPVPAGADAAH